MKNNQDFTFSENDFSKLFPFYFKVNVDMDIVAIGKTLEKMQVVKPGENFSSAFAIIRPAMDFEEFGSFSALANQMVIIKALRKPDIQLRGQIEILQEGNAAVFVGSPWFGSMENVKASNLSLHDFALHDPMIDLLHVLKTQEITNEELKQLLTTIKHQKLELEKSAKRVEEIALFPLQNPDPLFRVSVDGALLMTNPAGEKCTSFICEGRTYAAVEFWKYLSRKIDFETDSWVVEAQCGEMLYSLECKPIKGHPYFNIYGRNITNEKKQAEQLLVLSRIVEENINAVVIADVNGRISWVNKSFTERTGYALDEVKGKRPDHLLVGDDTNLETLAYLQNKIESSESFGAEILNYTKEGQPYWARILGQPIFDGQGKLAGYFALQQDITREKEIEARMHDADKRMRLALEQIGDNVWEHDFEKGETTFSKADNEFVGITNQAGNENATLWWESVHAEDKHLLTENDRKYKSGSIQSHRLEYRMVCKDGSIRWVLDRGVVIEKDDIGLPLRIVGTHTDISKIKQTEIELKQRVSQFKALAENIPGVIYEYAFHPDGTDGLSYISPAIERIFGIAPDDFKNYLSYVHEEDRATLLEKNKKSRETLEPFYDESRLVIPGKPLLWQSVQSSFSYRTESGSIIFTGFILDITQRKNAENELIKQQQFYENILNNIPADVAVFNHKHQYLFINPVAIGNAELRKWIIGKTDEEYCYLRNRPLSVAHERRVFFNKLLETKKGTAFEERILKPNNEEAYYLRKMYPVVGDDGEISIVIGYGIDITDRKRAEEIVKANEEKYRGIIANMNLGLLEVDNEDRIQYANDSFLQMSHYTEAELYGQSASAILLSEEGRQLIAEKNVLRERGVKDAYELPVIDKNGAQRWWLISGAPRLNDRGEVVGSIGIHLDITNQKKLEAELREAKAMAEESSDAKERFLANMSHEIRTPMNAIMGLSRQLKKTTLDKKQSQYLDSILTASDNLLVIINDILDLSKIEAGKLALEQIGFSIQSQLRQVSSLLMHRAEEKGLWLDVQVDERLAGIHIGDPFRLHQIFINLAGNAIKFTSNGGILLSAKLVQQQGTQQLISFSVADTGVGISDDFKEQLFDAFSQEHNSTQRTYGGSGLGLSISRQLVHLMNGNLQVKSKQGKGSVFSFELWLGMGNESDLPVAKTLANAQDVLAGKWILLVEDNSMNRLVASTLLHQYGAEVHEAENGAIALSALQHTHYDVVLMDIQMPVLDGIATTRKIREIYGASLPVIALTANALPSERANTLAAGMNDFITKPFEEVEFIETIAKWAGSSTTILEKVAPPAMLSHTGLVKLYNLQKMEEISHGNKAFLLRMVQLFCRQAPEMAAALRQHFEKAEWKQMGAVAHKMKPAIDNMMIDSLKEVIRGIEKIGKTAMEVPELPEWIDRVEAVVSKVVASMALEFELTPE